MTIARVSCANCGARRMVGALLVYLRAPGAVVRCPQCGSVAMVLATIRGEMRIDMRGVGGIEAD